MDVQEMASSCVAVLDGLAPAPSLSWLKLLQSESVSLASFRFFAHEDDLDCHRIAPGGASSATGPG
eukprot:3782725-Pyramimonas_sp.AAC.1